MPKYLWLGALTALLLFSVVVGPTIAETTATPTPTPTAAKRIAEKRATVNLACMQTAVDKRESALIAMADTYHTSMVAVLKTRQTALKSAWGLTDRTARRIALRTAWQAYRQSGQQTRITMRQAKKAAWKTFRDDRKKCGTLGTIDDGTNEAVDIGL